MYSVARLCHDQSVLSLCHRRRVAGHSMLYKINLNSNHCLFSELPSASTRVGHTRSAAATFSLKYEVTRCRASQFARSFLPTEVRMWNDLSYTGIETGTLDGFEGAVNRWLLPRVEFSSVCFSGCESNYEQLCFSHLGLCCWY